MDMERLAYYLCGYRSYELATHGADPGKDLKGTMLRLLGREAEGYKYRIYDNARGQLNQGRPYVPKIMDALPGDNLVSFHQKKWVQDQLNKQGSDRLESALVHLYEGDDDAQAFDEIVACVGRRFDVLGFLFFIKDQDTYLPVRSWLFDKRFKLLGIQSALSGHCTWEKYLAFIGWIREIQELMRSTLHPEITLLDAHSFLWMLPVVDSYMKDNNILYFKDVYPDTVPETKDTPIQEGAKKQITVNAYERSSQGRSRCIASYLNSAGKITCQICGFDFGQVYGPEYANLIHVHHVVPMSEIGEEYVLDPTKDLIPVCPNCHMVLHAKGGISVEELKKRVKRSGADDVE